MTDGAHVAEILLRKQRAGELQGAEREGVIAHTVRCSHCRARLSGLDDEQRAFERAIPFERFSAGVARAAREPLRDAGPRARWLYPMMAVAATVTLVTIALPVMRQPQPPTPAHNRVKGGGAAIDLRIAAGSGGPQRAASSDAPEPIIPGEHLRVVYRTGGHGYVMAITIDADGIVGPLHPETGASERVTGSAEALQYLPAFELTGRGAERVVVILSDSPIRFEEVRAAAEQAFETAGRDVTKMGDLAVAGEQFHRTLLKQ